MDDYNVNVLSEAKNEYSSRLVSTLTPLLIQGIKSIFNEAVNLCTDNSENEKYLMTFQNFLSRVPKWNDTIVNEETKRIVEASQCPYLEDLLTCVHITQLKILTSIRVSQKQKKIDLDIPKLNVFIHKCYISFARKLYSNVYLFEKEVAALQHQKNMRECELICHECILGVIRDSMPVETILRAYIDETVDEEVQLPEEDDMEGGEEPEAMEMGDEEEAAPAAEADVAAALKTIADALGAAGIDIEVSDDGDDMADEPEMDMGDAAAEEPEMAEAEETIAPTLDEDYYQSVKEQVIARLKEEFAAKIQNEEKVEEH